MSFYGGGPSHMLQTTLQSASATYPGEVAVPHHPIQCSGDLFFDEEGAFACEHVQVPPTDRRTQACLDASMAMLIIEMAFRQL